MRIMMGIAILAVSYAVVAVALIDLARDGWKSIARKSERINRLADQRVLVRAPIRSRRWKNACKLGGYEGARPHTP